MGKRDLALSGLLSLFSALLCASAPLREMPSARAEDAVTVVRIGAPIVRSAAPPNTERPKEAKDLVELAGPATAPDIPPSPEQCVDLATALARAGVENPTIARAAEVVRVAQAELLGARALLLPTLNAGSNVHVHRGNLLGSSGIVRDLHSDSVYVGAGASAVGGTVAIPGVHLVAHLADALFEPQAARERVAGRGFDSEATRNRILLNVADRYLDLAGAEARLQAIRQSETDLAKVVQMTADFYAAKQGSKPDADRAQTEAMLLRTQEQNAEAEIAVASAELARLLNLDPSVRLRVADEVLPLVQLVDPAASLPQLLEIARNNRPEIRARSADVTFAEARLREERVRPFVPMLSVGYSAGGFGGGSNLVSPRFGKFDTRSDFDVFAFWSLQNLGFGNLAIQRERRGEVGEAEAVRARVVYQVNREVADAYALSAARRQEVDVAARRVQRMQEGFDEDLRAARNQAARPIELLNSLNLLRAAREDLVRAIVGYDQAQFQLFVSLGQPPPPQ